MCHNQGYHHVLISKICAHWIVLRFILGFVLIGLRLVLKTVLAFYWFNFFDHVIGQNLDLQKVSNGALEEKACQVCILK